MQADNAANRQEFCTCTIACIPQGLIGEQSCRLRAETDLASLTEAEFWPLVEQAKERVLTNDLDALERLIVDGLPADEMQAAAWVLVQRVRGLKDDLARVERARAAWQREAPSANA